MYSGNISRRRKGLRPRQWGATSFCRFDSFGRCVLPAQTGLRRSPRRSLSAMLRIPVMPDGYSNLKPDRYSNLMPDTIPI